MFDELVIYFENPARDPLGHESVEGKLVCGADGVLLEFKLKDRAFRKGTLDRIEIAYGEVESVSYSAPFFGPKLLVLRTRNTGKLEEVPGAEVGEVRLHVRRSSRDSARKAADFVDYMKSEILLQERDDRLSGNRPPRE